MILNGTLAKMRAKLGEVVDYQLPVGDQLLPLNDKLGKKLRLTFRGNIICQYCSNKTKKSFSQGYCFYCMRKLARCDMCIVKPETCHFHEGTCREPQWAEKNCFVPHYVYLSNTSGLKVGITRCSQVPIRWIDQGATQGMTIFKVNTRRQSGLIEAAFKSLIADKTNWRAMLKGSAESRNLNDDAVMLKSQLTEKLSVIMVQFNESGDGEEAVTLSSLTLPESQSVEINYPVLAYPSKIVSHNFDKNPVVEGMLMGIKGQYLIFDTAVINIRKFTGYEVEVSQ